MKKTPQEHVVEFYEAFNQGMPAKDSTPSLTNELLSTRLNLKMDLIFEEFVELVEAVYGHKSGAILKTVWEDAKNADENNRDIVEAADAMGDLFVVIAGLAIESNVDLDVVLAEIQRSNLSKLDKEGNPILSDGVTPAPDGEVKPKGKILKGPDFTPPNIAGILGL